MTMTFDPNLDLVDIDDVSPITDATCECPACVSANVQAGPGAIVPHAWQGPDGRWMRVGRKLHGFELRRHLQIRDRVFQRARESMTRQSEASA